MSVSNFMMHIIKRLEWIKILLCIYIFIEFCYYWQQANELCTLLLITTTVSVCIYENHINSLEYIYIPHWIFYNIYYLSIADYLFAELTAICAVFGYFDGIDYHLDKNCLGEKTNFN